MQIPVEPLNERQLTRRLVEIISERLPEGWTVRPSLADYETHPRLRTDLTLDITAPDGRAATLAIEAKRLVEGRDVAPLHSHLARQVSHMKNGAGAVGARYLSPPVRARLAESGLSYIDATGNIRLSLSEPGLYLSDRGADADPWRGPGRPRGTLKGAPAAKVVRAITDFSGEWQMRDLIEISGASTGATYRVVEFLESEGLATRSKRGRLVIPHWEPILRRWSDDYGFVRNNRTSRWIAPRGLGDLIERAAASTEMTTYAVTGTLAAAEWAPYAPARSAMIYVTDAEAAAAAWNLKPADAGANVLLAEPQFDAPFLRTLDTLGGLRIAAAPQVAVDLMTGPGRSPSEAEELIQWMVNNEHSWRR